MHLFNLCSHARPTSVHAHVERDEYQLNINKPTLNLSEHVSVYCDTLETDKQTKNKVMFVGKCSSGI